MRLNSLILETESLCHFLYHLGERGCVQGTCKQLLNVKKPSDKSESVGRGKVTTIGTISLSSVIWILHNVIKLVMASVHKFNEEMVSTLPHCKLQLSYKNIMIVIASPVIFVTCGFNR